MIDPSVFASACRQLGEAMVTIDALEAQLAHVTAERDEAGALLAAAARKEEP